MVAAIAGLLLILLIVNAVGYGGLSLGPDGLLRFFASLPQWIAIAGVVGFIGWCLRDDEDRSPPPGL
jgi:hypothetical protein